MSSIQSKWLSLYNLCLADKEKDGMIHWDRLLLCSYDRRSRDLNSVEINLSGGRALL